MDWFGYGFIAIAAICFIVGIFVGLFKSLLNLVGFVISCGVGAVAALLLGKPMANLIDDSLLFFGYALAFVIGFFVVFGVFIFIKYIVQRALNTKKGLRVVDFILGPVIHLAICWVVFGAIFAFSGLILSGADSSTPAALTNVAASCAESNILNAVYGAFNPMGFISNFGG